MKDYLISIWGSGNFENLSEDQMGAFFDDFDTWVTQLEDKGQMVTRHRIAGDFKYAQLNGDQTEIVNSSHHGGKNGLAGVFIIKAQSEDEACEIARTCPPVKHLKDIVEIVELSQ